MNLLDEGSYRAKALRGALGETKGGKEQVGVQFSLLDLGDATITWYGYFTDKTTESTIKALRTMGWTGDDLSNLTGIETNEVTLVIEHEDDKQGRTHAKVRWVNGTGGPAMKSALSPDKAKAFAARMKGQVVAISRNIPPPAPPMDNDSEGDPGPTDDIPF